MDMNLEMTESLAPDGTSKTLRLKGPLVLSNLFPFQTAVRGSQAANLILEMTEVPYIDSSAVGVLVGAYVSHEKSGRTLLLVGVTPRVRTVLQVTKVDQFFKFADTLPG